jgi:hypothetical protein
MKQIEQALQRYFDKQLHRPSDKWKVISTFPGHHIVRLYHYHHLVLMYDTRNQIVIYQWFEKPTDLRGLIDALEQLTAKYNKGPFYSIQEFEHVLETRR